MSSNRNPSIDVQPILEILEPRLMLDGVGEPDPLDLPGAAPPAAPASTMLDDRQFNPSSRMGGLIISEIMYNPLDPDGVGGVDPDDLEFIEIYNSEEVPNDLSRYALTGEADFVFPEGTVLAGRSYLVVASNPTVAESFYGITGVLGPYTGHLTNGGGTQRLRNQMNAILQDVQYSDDYPWPAASDGAGHSLVMMRPDYGADNVLAWEASDYVNGNPGTSNRTFTDDLANVVINEVLVHTDLPDIDFVELYNHSNSSANIGNMIISDRRPDDPASEQGESVGIGNGATDEFTGTLLRDSLRSGTVQFTDGTQIVTDDGFGNLVGDVNPGGTNSIDYATGAFSVTFAAAPLVDAAITADYEYITDYRIPFGTSIGPRGFVSFDQNTLGFSLNMQGDEVYLWNSAGDRVVDAIKFGAQENGVSMGRYADGADEFRVLSSPTPGVANEEPVNYDIVINEIMYNPVTDHQNEVVGVGDGTTADFAGTLGRDLLRKGSIQFTDGSQVVTDDGNGNLVGDVNPGGDNEIDYDTGAFSLTLAAAPVLYVRVTVDYDVNSAFEETDYEFIELYNRGGSDVDLGNWKLTEGIRYTFPAFKRHQQEPVAVGDAATTEFTGSLPQDDLRAGSIQFTDGAQIVTDDGAGNLIGDVNPGGTNSIDYATGAFSVTFAAAPTAGTPVTVNYENSTILRPGEYLVVAKDDRELIAANPGVLNAGNTIGDYSGQLSNRGERIVLSRPDDPLLPDQDFIVIDEVLYTDGESWGIWADGGGSSLELIDPHSDNMRASNWADSDETDKASWTLITYTGELDHGRNSADEIQVLMEGKGEALLDDVEVFKPGEGNLVANGTFESGIGGWTIQGTHIDSHWETGEGYNSSRSLRLVSSRTGDNSVNRVEHDFSSAMYDGNIATIQARVRWLAGTAGILLRTHGGWIEAPGIMDLPTNLGTPGAVNSQYVVNAGPAIYDVTHLPILPAAGQNVVVTARVADVDGLSSVELKYRNDTDAPSSIYTVTMNDNGVSGDAIAGDGIYSATMPGQGSNDLVAFYVQATDSHASAVTTRFPTALDGEAHVMFGQGSRSGTFGTYRFWMTEADRAQWQNRQKHSDHPIHGTFVYGDFRVIYNAGGRFRGSPWIRSNGNPETLGTSYVLYVPKDSRVIGSTSFNMDRLESDGTKQAERMALWLADQTDTPFFNERYIHLYINERAKTPIYSDSHSPNDNYVNAYWSSGTDGELFKIDDWFEFNDASQVNKEFNSDGQMQQYLTGGEKNQGRYRWSWRKEPLEGFDDDYSNFFDLVDAMNYDYTSDQFASTVPLIVDYDEWMHTFAVQHVIRNWDSYGYNRGKNMSLYLPDDGKWQMIMWDLDHDHLVGNVNDNNLFSINDSVLRNEFFNYPLFRRAYWRAIYEITDAMEASKINPVMDANYWAFQANGVGVTSPDSALKAWVAGRRSFLLGQITAIDAGFAITTSGGADFSTGQQIVTIAGTAPVAVKTMHLNGVEVEVDFSSITNWSLQFGLTEGDNVLAFEGFDYKGNLVASDTITVTLTNPGVSPLGQIVINEIMYNPADAVEQGEYIEIYNASSVTAFDMSGWRIDGADFTFGPGSIITAGEYVIVAENAANFVAAYGSSPTVLGQYNGSLSNGGERLRLQMPAGGLLWTTVDEVTYSDDLPWPEMVDGDGPSLQRIDPTKDSGWIGNWAADASTHYTPGAVNSVYEILPAFPQVRINEIMGNNVSTLQDNAGDYDPWIELYDAGSANVLAVEVHQANPNGGDATMELSLNFSQPAGSEIVSVIPVGSIWSYLDDGTDQGVAWRELGYDDAAWESGPGRLGYGDTDGRISTTLDYGPSANDKYITYYFRHKFWVDNPSLFTSLDLLVQRDDGIIVYLNDNEILRDHMPTSGEINYETTATGGTVGSSDEIAWIPPQNPVDPAYLVSGWNIMTAEIHQENATSSDIGFDMNLSGVRTIVGANTEIIPLDATWKYLDDGSDQGTMWRDPGFDDGAWSSGAAILGYGNGDETTAVTADRTTYYFRHTINLQETAIVNPALNLRADDGAIVYLNGTEILRVNMPAGSVDFSTEALAPIEGIAEADFTETVINPGLFQDNVGLGVLTNMRLTDDYTQPFKWSFPTDTPLTGGEYITVWVDGETAQQTPTDMHTSFAMDGLPASLALVWDYNGTPIVVDYVDYDYTPDDQSQGRWPNGQGEMFAMDSPTPAAFNSGPSIGQLIINEVHYNPTDLNDFEFIEIFNRSGNTVDLWETYDAIDYPWDIEGFKFAVGTSLLPDEIIVVVPFDPIAEPDTLAAFKTRYGLELSSVQIVGGYGNKLDNGGEMIRLERPLPLVGSPAFTPYETVDAVRYDDEAPWPTAPDAGGDSLHRIFADAWGNAVDNWTTAPPNPGTFVIANSAPHVANPIADMTVDEDDGDTVLDLSATFDDIDLGELLTLSVSDNSNIGLVTTNMVGTDLTLSYVADQNGSADITVRATDQGGLWVEETFTVTVNPLGDPPTVANPIDDVTVDEDSGSDLLDLSAVFHDPDLFDVPPDTLTITVTGNTNPGLVTTGVDGMGLTLSYVPLHDGTADITVRATDGDSNEIEDTFTVTVNPINHPPHVQGSLDVVVNEDAPDMPIDLAPAFADVDPGDTLTFSILSNTEPSLVSATLDVNILTLSFTPEASGTAIIRVRATDSGTPELWIDETFSVTVDPVNDAPTVADPIDNVLAFENDPDTVLNLAGVFDDVDIGDSLTLS
ncbi:MAG: lamin tail domain-containing protein, partial [Phycisphaerae bacterium]|nr:lamin tail domain-containing protein [Phycisphaerae bacterium]